MSRALTLSLGATTLRAIAAPLAARPGSSPASCVSPSLRLHRRGHRSACARLRRVGAWRARRERLSDTVLDDGDVNALDEPAGTISGNMIAQEIGCIPPIRRSSQSGPSTFCIQDSFSVFHLNP